MGAKYHLPPGKRAYLLWLKACALGLQKGAPRKSAVWLCFTSIATPLLLVYVLIASTAGRDWLYYASEVSV